MGPAPEEITSQQIRRVADSILADCHELTEEQKRAVKEFGEERRRQFEADPPRGSPSQCQTSIQASSDDEPSLTLKHWGYNQGMPFHPHERFQVFCQFCYRKFEEDSREAALRAVETHEKGECLKNPARVAAPRDIIPA